MCLKIFLGSLLSLLAVSSSFAEVKAYLNQESFFEGDPVTLKIESSENNKETPDISPLEKDFTILGTSTNSQLSTMNGKRSFLKSWTIKLEPTKKGTIQIPSITIGNEKTKPLALVITDLPPEVIAETQKHVFIEESIDIKDSTTYVQQQIPYTIKLFYDASMQTAEINTPSIDNAILEKLGRDQRYRVIRGGERFNVIEKRYVISPEKSGVLHIPAATVKGRIALSGGDSQSLRRQMDETDMLNSFFNDFRSDPFFQDFGGGFLTRRSQGPSKPFSMKGKTIDVEVLPVPKAFSGAVWLPAEDLIIKDSWTTRPPQLKVGEPITRLLTLQAKGLAGSQIPDIPIPKPYNMRAYPDKAKSETATDGNTVYGIQRINISYISDSSGKVNIPEIKVDWWDVKNKKQKTFVLPAWNFNVAPDPTRLIEKKSPSELFQEPSSRLKNNSAVTVDDNLSAANKFWDQTLIIIAPLLLLFAALFYRFRKYQVKKGGQQVFQQEKYSLNIATLLQACHTNDKQQATQNLLKYAQVYWHDDSLQNLGMIASKLETSSDVKIIKGLEQSLYSLESESWQGDALAKLIENGLPHKQKRAQQQDDLIPLYPA